MNKDWYKPYDSPEELYVSWYLDELGEAGYVIQVDFHPDSYRLSPQVKYKRYKMLKTKIKEIPSTLLQEHIYTPDFLVYWTQEAVSIFFKGTGGPFFPDMQTEILQRTIWEVKPPFDRNNMTRLFTINQKWVYDKYGVYVQKIIPQKLFRDTFTPQRYLLTDSGKQKRKLIFAPKTLEEYVESRKG